VSVGTNPEITSGLGLETRHKSAGLAFLLSLIVPGAGQLYCGKSFRGGLTLGFSFLGLVLAFMRHSESPLRS
jgi:hypothetical protein